MTHWQIGNTHAHTHAHAHKHTPIYIHTECHPDLLDILFGPDVRRMYQGAHDLHIAMYDKGLVRPVSVDANSAVVVDWVRQLATLPQHLVVTFKLAGVGRLWQSDKGEGTDKLSFRY